MKSKKNYLTLLSFLCLASVHSQEASTAAGADATGAGGSASYSIGQVSYVETAKNISVSQGVQQAYQIPFATILGINLRLSIYPNPATNIFSVEVKNLDYASLRYQVHDLRGNLLASRKAISHRTDFVIAHFAAGTYILQVFQNNEQVKSFKVIKTNR